MPIDPSIPLQVTQQFQQADPEKMLSLAEFAQRFKQQQQEQKTQNTLKQIMNDPSAVGPDGLPTTDTLGKITKVDPPAGLKLMDEVSQVQTRQTEAKVQNSELFGKKAGMQNDVVSDALEEYDTKLAAGLPPDQAKQEAQKALSRGYEDLKKSGLYSTAEVASWPTSFDPTTLSAGAKKYQAWKKQQEDEDRANKKEDLAEKRANQEFELKKAELGERMHHDTAEEAHSRAQLGMEGARLGLERQRLGFEETKYKDSKSGGLSDDAVKGIASRVLAGDRSALQGIPRTKQGAADQDRIQNMIYTVAKEQGMSPKQISQAQAGFAAQSKALNILTAQAGKMEAVEGAAAGAAKQFKDAYKDLGVVSDVKGLNAFVQHGQDAISDPKLKRAMVAANGLATEYASAMNRGGAPHVEALHEARKLIADSVKEGPRAVQATVDQIQREIDNVKQANESAIAGAEPGGATFSPGGGGSSAPPAKRPPLSSFAR